MLIDEETRRDPRALGQLLQGASRATLPPFVALDSPAEVIGEEARELALYRGDHGRRAAPHHARDRAFFAALGSARVEHHYGPSETHVATAEKLEGKELAGPAVDRTRHREQRGADPGLRD
ncbi:MAG: hypothetical protein U0527_02245 [Candidatus Eisenbacteria bacterium]